MKKGDAKACFLKFQLIKEQIIFFILINRDPNEKRRKNVKNKTPLGKSGVFECFAPPGARKPSC